MQLVKRFAAVLAATLAFASPAATHPHVWVVVEATVLYDNGRIIGVEHKWTFDEAYTAMAIEDLDKNGDGIYSREELAELAKVNIDGMEEFGYFTIAKLGDKRLEIKTPVDYWLEHKDGLLSLHFTVPLAEPVLAGTEGFNFMVADESFFIAFDFAKDNAVKLGAGAPAGCAANLAVPEKDLEDLQALNQALNGQATAGTANLGQGGGYAQTVTVTCKKS